MNIASLVLRARPERIPVLRQEILSIPGSEIHAESGDGRIIVTIEDTPGHDCAEALVKVQQLDHVISLTLAYEHCESES